MKGTGKKYKRIRQLLSVSGSSALKVWRLYAPLKVLAVVLLIAVTASVGTFAYRNLAYPLIPSITVGGIVRYVGGIALAFVLANIVGKRVMQVVQWRDSVKRTLYVIGMTFGGWILARIHLSIFDKLFLRIGSLRKLDVT
jgi:hypothetical protein